MVLSLRHGFAATPTSSDGDKPVQIGEDVVGVRIAVRDIAEGQEHKPESQIYNWGIKRDASLDGAQPAKNDSSRDISSDASNDNISKLQEKVNDDYISKEAISKNEVASFLDKKTTAKINSDEVISGMWEGAENSTKNKNTENVEKSQLKKVENVGENGIIEKTRVLTLDDLTKDVLKTKPHNSRVPSDWIKAGGSIAIDDNGNWIYTDWFGNSVKYIDGYPDYRGAGFVFQMVNIGEFKNRGIDRRLADKLAPNGPRRKGNVWHHSQDGYTLEEISKEIHERFTHRGGISNLKGIKKYGF